MGPCTIQNITKSVPREVNPAQNPVALYFLLKIRQEMHLSSEVSRKSP